MDWENFIERKYRNGTKVKNQELKNVVLTSKFVFKKYETQVNETPYHISFAHNFQKGIFDYKTVGIFCHFLFFI